ncbi:fructosamine-3-kinase [Thioflavicoccus mobilis 8321]|uniref:Fructosamine-3-kinase n=1 Tax=Thioflavicoccus mobilis 8321 TaxID=765912 RepID=L0H0H3_9GAMM|nr:fructosamine kinase family protein [Thioflavicoccus mobilis]AGA91135.1 fructosamine-3-kinase [Thioflavicoccus mobilis 8321]
MADWQDIATHIAAVTGEPFAPRPPRHVGGGCINTALRLGDGQREYFIKLNDAAGLAMFEAEATGLAALAATETLRVPSPLCTGTSSGQAFLAMEYIPLGGRPRGDGAATAGRLLAAMHRASTAEFGWERDNTIGSSPQPNTPERDWVVFWRERRLGHQLQLAAANGYRGRLQERGVLLLERFGALIDHTPVPSLLHGDLWGGNMGFGPEGEPVIFDPAVYYGDREADLAMTELFGGFGGDFYAAYREAWPLAPGYAVRKTLYNLYHILNHLNLFGGGYRAQAEGMIDRLLAEIG